MKRLFYPVVSLIVASAHIGFAQDAKDDYKISLDVSRVVLYATVREGKARFVGDLAKEDFQIREDGKPQEIREFRRDEVPVTIGLVIDNSQSMMNKRKEIIEAARAFIRASNSKDEMFIIHFNERISYGLPAEAPFSSDPALLGKGLDKLVADGKTALYDAINEALKHLQNSKLSKKALVVISDGGDNASLAKSEDVVRRADLSGALFYGIGIYDEMDGDANPGVLRKLASSTGGESYFPEHLSGISELCERIARDLRNQYTLVYAPSARPGDQSYHRVEVKVKDPQHRKLTVRTRTGYYSAAGDQSTTKP